MISSFSKYIDSLGSKQAQWPPAVGNHLDIGIEIIEMRLQVFQWHRNGTWYVSCLVFHRRSDVQHHHFATTHLVQQLGSADTLGAARTGANLLKNLLHFSKAGSRQHSKRRYKTTNLFAGGPVTYASAIPPDLHQASLPHDL